MADKLYMVQAGENLKSIARDQLGAELRWQELAFVNSLSHPYMITPGQLLLLPSVDSPLEIVVSGGSKALPDKGNAPTPAKLKLSPAELALVFGGVALLWWLMR